MIRNDFVSNSSSSSFIIGFKNEDIKDNFMIELMNGWGEKGKELIFNFFEYQMLTEKDKNDELCAYKNIKEEDKKEYPLMYSGLTQSWRYNEIELFAHLLIYFSVYENPKVGIKILYYWDS